MINHKDLTWKFIRIEKQSKNIHQLHKYKSSSVENHTLHNSELLKHPNSIHVLLQTFTQKAAFESNASQMTWLEIMSNGKPAFDFQQFDQWWSCIWFPMSNGEAVFDFQCPMVKQDLISNVQWRSSIWIPMTNGRSSIWFLMRNGITWTSGFTN